MLFAIAAIEIAAAALGIRASTGRRRLLCNTRRDQAFFNKIFRIDRRAGVCARVWEACFLRRRRSDASVQTGRAATLATLQPWEKIDRAVEGLGDGGRCFSRFTGAWVVCRIQ